MPLTQLPEAVALESLTPSSGLGGGGSSAASACVMSTLPMPGTGIVVAGIGAEPAGTPTDRFATSPVAPAVCWAGWLAEPSSVVRADMTLACSGIGNAGRFAPPLAALHVAWPTLAVIGVPSGCPLTAAAEQFQPAAEADADMTTNARRRGGHHPKHPAHEKPPVGLRTEAPTTMRGESSGFRACPWR